MSFKRFDIEDIVVSSDSISSPAWSNNLLELTRDGLEPDLDQISANSGNYYHNMYLTGSQEISSRDIQFSVAYGHKDGLGSAYFDSAVTTRSYSKTVYGQFRTLLNGDEDSNFQFGDNEPGSVFFISVERARYKEKILPGSLTLVLGVGSNQISLTDNSLSSTINTFKDGGREYLIYKGAQGTVTDSSVVYGKLYPDVGVIVLNGDLLDPNVVSIDTANPPSSDNISSFRQSITSFKLRAEETISSNYVFVRARNSEFNYSTNPSNITGSGELQHDVMIDTPQAYITAVGLYNDNNDLLAVSKLSKPLLKDFTKEALIRIKLDY